jgi:hypothetical protein
MLDHVYSSQKVSCSWPCMRLVSGNESLDKLSVEATSSEVSSFQFCCVLGLMFYRVVR